MLPNRSWLWTDSRRSKSYLESLYLCVMLFVPVPSAASGRSLSCCGQFYRKVLLWSVMCLSSSLAVSLASLQQMLVPDHHLEDSSCSISLVIAPIVEAGPRNSNYQRSLSPCQLLLQRYDASASFVRLRTWLHNLYQSQFKGFPNLINSVYSS